VYLCTREVAGKRVLNIPTSEEDWFPADASCIYAVNESMDFSVHDRMIEDLVASY
jgi:hypothetical protein